MALALLFPTLLLLSLPAPLAFSATDTISSAHPLAGTEKLVSVGGKFALGLFQPSNSSPRYYLAIWYHSVPKTTPVWVANGASPVSDPAAAAVRIAANGNIVLLDGFSESPVWSTAANLPINFTVAVLLDTGNLVLQDASNSSLVFWQSFDHPTNTWLPGSKLGLNKTTGVSQRLVSWKNSADPAPGIFFHELDPNGSSQFMIWWNDSVKYWSSGTWNGHYFNGIPEMTGTLYDTFQYVSNAEENYFAYRFNTNNSIITGFFMDVSGQVKQQIWVEATQEWMLFWSEPRAQCEVYALCGPFGICNERSLPYCNCLKGFSQKSTSDWALDDQSGGCTRNTPLQCESRSTGKTHLDKFYTMDSVRLPINAQSSGVDNAKECELACLNNCSCTAYAYESNCSLWYGKLIHLQDQYNGTDGGTLYLRLAASELSTPKRRKGPIIGILVGGIIAIVASLIVVAILKKHSRERTKIVEGNLVAFTYSELQRVTKNFSEKLGCGGFGSVFKGLLSDSTAIAVKKLDESGFLHGEKQFRAEVVTIGRIQHINLVRLIGFCTEGSRRLLVYEFMPNKSLATQLFHSNSTMLSWKIRYQIALGIARGLAYLHEKCRDCIIHCDIKPENILLDASFIPKVADFGLAKLLGRDSSRVLTTTRGTIGYLAPEWITGIPITAKADVYSYGMMLFEIISGKRNSDPDDEGRSCFFPIFAMKKIIEGDLQSSLDQKLNRDANIKELERVCTVACWCIQDDENTRPTMGQVVQILEGFLEVNIPPMPTILRFLEESPIYVNFNSRMSSVRSTQTKSITFASSQT